MIKVSDQGLLEIAEHEGIVPAPYKDSKGIWTFGIGHTAGAGGLDPREMNSRMPNDVDAAIVRALQIFREDIANVEKRIQAVIKTPLKQHQIDALASWDLNTGGLTWKHKTTKKPCQLVQQINSGNLSADGFMGWLRPIEIKGRREEEQELFRSGDYSANGDHIAVWETDGKGNLRRIMKTIKGRDLLKVMKAATVVMPTEVGDEHQSLWDRLLEKLR